LAVIVFSIVGICLLGLVSYISEVKRVDLSDLESHTGRTVEIDGTVVGAEHDPSGVTRILLYGDGFLVEATIDRSSKEVGPGDRILLRGEPYVKGGVCFISSPTDRSMEVKEGGLVQEFSLSSPGEICTLEGIVLQADNHGYRGYNLTLEIPDQDGGRVIIWALALESDGDPGPGDIITVTGLRSANDGLVSFGNDAIVINYKATPMMSEIAFLVGSDPYLLPREPITLEGYLRYTPRGRSFYIGEASEGSSISIRVQVEESPADLSRGDRLMLSNCTISYDPTAMRYSLLPSEVQLVESHGPWILSLGNLSFGIGDYEGCEVILDGVVEEDIDRSLIRDGEATLELRGGPVSSPVSGIVRYDTMKSAYYLEVVMT